MKPWQIVAIALAVSLVVTFFAVRNKIPVVNPQAITPKAS